MSVTIVLPPLYRETWSRCKTRVQSPRPTWASLEAASYAKTRRPRGPSTSTWAPHIPVFPLTTGTARFHSSTDYPDLPSECRPPSTLRPRPSPHRFSVGLQWRTAGCSLQCWRLGRAQWERVQEWCLRIWRVWWEAFPHRCTNSPCASTALEKRVWTLCWAKLWVCACMDHSASNIMYCAIVFIPTALCITVLNFLSKQLWQL